MSARFFIHLGFLVSAVIITYFWSTNRALTPYTLQLVGFLVIFYFLSRPLTKTRIHLATGLDGLIFAVVTLILVYQTGGITSPVFFLLYILLFGLSLLFDPLITLTFALTLCFLFYHQVVDINGFLEVVSLLIITPVALFFSKQYLKVLENEEKIKIILVKKKELEKKVADDEKDTLLWLTLNFKQHINQILDTSSNLLADVGRLTILQREELHKIHESAKRLLKMGERLKEKVEEHQ